jgi:hypothetical protein
MNTRKEQLLDNLMKVTNENQAQEYKLLLDNLFASLCVRYPDLTSGFLEHLRMNHGESWMLEKIKAAYAKILSEEDIEGAIAFYSSDVGRKFLFDINSAQEVIGAEYAQMLIEKCNEASFPEISEE